VLGTAQHFQPKILLTVDDNVAVSVDLSPETKQMLEDLMNHRKVGPNQSSSKIVEVTEREQLSADQADPQPTAEEVENSVDDGPGDENIFETDEDVAKSEPARELRRQERAEKEHNMTDFEEKPKTRTIEITLRADSEFFNLLTKELSSIDKLQARQKEQLTSEVDDLSQKVLAVTSPSKSEKKSDLYVWREIFSVYRDASVFFATTERDHGARTAEQARERVQWFSDQLSKRALV
jgi:SPX domain